MYFQVPSEQCDHGAEVVLILDPLDAALLGQAVQHLAETRGAMAADSECTETAERMRAIMTVLHVAEFAGWLNAQAEEIMNWLDSEEEEESGENHDPS